MSGDSSEQSKSIEPLRSRPSKQWGIPGALFFGIIAFLVPDLVMASVGGSLALLPLTQNERNFTGIVFYELLVIGIVTLVVKAYGRGVRELGLHTFKLQYIWYALVAFVLYFPLSIAITFVVSTFLPYDQDQVQPLGFINPVGLEAVLIFIGLVIVVPFAEELLFRGFIFTGFRRRLSFVWTSLIVSALFAAAHGQVNVGLDVFALSLVLCFMREQSNSLWPAFLLHAIKNGVAFVAIITSTGFTG